MADLEHTGPKRHVFMRIVVPAEVTDRQVIEAITDPLIDAFLTDPYVTVYPEMEP